MAATASTYVPSIVFEEDYMRIVLHPLRLLYALTVTTVVLTACSPKDNGSRSNQLEAIDSIRVSAGIPASPLEFVEMTTMINSPTGGLTVALYQDSQGRKYMVEPKANYVVEIDARAILQSISPDLPTLTRDELRAKAEQLISATIAGFGEMRSGLSYEEGQKGDYWFFNWTGVSATAAVNRPFAQVGLRKSGELFAYYNTLLLK